MDGHEQLLDLLHRNHPPLKPICIAQVHTVPLRGSIKIGKILVLSTHGQFSFLLTYLTQLESTCLTLLLVLEAHRRLMPTLLFHEAEAGPVHFSCVNKLLAHIALIQS